MPNYLQYLCNFVYINSVHICMLMIMAGSIRYVVRMCILLCISVRT